MSGTVRVLLFATAREAVGRSQVEVPVPEEGIGVVPLMDSLATRFPRLRTVLASSRIVRNGEFVTGGRARCRAGDELAVHPPYSGG